MAVHHGQITHTTQHIAIDEAEPTKESGYLINHDSEPSSSIRSKADGKYGEIGVVLVDREEVAIFRVVEPMVAARAEVERFRRHRSQPVLVFI